MTMQDYEELKASLKDMENRNTKLLKFLLEMKLDLKAVQLK